MSPPMTTIPRYANTNPGIQVGAKLRGAIEIDASGQCAFDENEIAFLKQMGIEWVMIGKAPEDSARCYRQMREQLEELGLKIYRLANNELHNMPEVTLNLEGRDRKIDAYLQYIGDLGEAGIHYATYAHMGNGIWRSDTRHTLRGGAAAGGLDLKAPNHGSWLGTRFDGVLSHGRPYSEEELWENYEHFIRKVVPVAESAGVYIGIHPDDPPAYPMGGIPRNMFGTCEGYKKALKIADSPHIGVCLCVGCWLEAGEAAGCAPVEFIRYLGERNQLFKLHVRNVTAPLSAPGGFAETFPDDGYADMAQVVAALDEVGFDGCIMSDHLVDMVGGRYTCEAYFTAYLKGLVDAVGARNGVR